MTIRQSLFDDMKRTDASSRQPNEPFFAYLNRSADREATEIRGRLESWFGGFPVKARDDVRGRFREDDDHAHRGATFELFIHELLIRLDCTVEVHPKISGKNSRPDFFARHGGCVFYVEATVIDSKENPLEEDVLAKINSLTSPHFHIFAKVDGKLLSAPSREQVVQPFVSLLDAHNPDEVQCLIDEGGLMAAPSRKIEYGAWSLQGWLVPMSPGKRRDHRSRTLIIGPARSEMVDCSTSVQRAVRKKAGKYGPLNARLWWRRMCAIRSLIRSPRWRRCSARSRLLTSKNALISQRSLVASPTEFGSKGVTNRAIHGLTLCGCSLMSFHGIFAACPTVFMSTRSHAT